MKTIWKYTLKPTLKLQTILMPKWARILHVDSQQDAFCIWVLVDPNGELSPRSFLVVGTGCDANEANQGKYLGTVKVLNEREIYHIFEV